MRKVLFLLLFLNSFALVIADHSKCHDPHCLGLLTTVTAYFTPGSCYTTVTIPVPPEGIKDVYGALNPHMTHYLGGTVDIVLTFDESCVGKDDVSFDVVTNERGNGTSIVERELFYHVEVRVMGWGC